MTNLFAILLTLGFVVTPTPKITATVTEITATERAIVEVDVDRGYEVDAYEFDFPIRENDYEAEIESAYIGQTLNVNQIYGTFYGTWEGINYQGERETFYQFKAYDDSVWWALTESDMGFIPTEDKPYVLAFDENKNTKANHSCPEEYDCDCYCYDDLFLGVYELR